MRSCVADGQTDGAGYIGPAEGYGGSNKTAKLAVMRQEIHDDVTSVHFTNL